MIAIICVVIILGVYIGQKSIGANTFTGKYTTGNLTWKFAGSYSKTTQEKLIAYPKKWSALSSNLNLTKEGDSYKYSRFRIRYNLTKPPLAGLLGQTFLFTKEGSELGINDRWWKVTCSVYKNSSASSVNKHATLIHEAGHAFSMAHCSHSEKQHIMHQGLKSYTAVSSYEKDELRKKWGK